MIWYFIGDRCRYRAIACMKALLHEWGKMVNFTYSFLPLLINFHPVSMGVEPS
ncbi:hypothetical protein [Nostoc sp. NMS4]|uniref:hypothetical protein n=1 Tax=Nostoc sp. NMS4 TaxID=2815390 RepID=UPI0025F68DE7|nr:hypothetical protein [Nostoc sp. NMS4]MBN3925394.1 hypothetical protein [Nostoc sp. NMS4]